MGKFLHFQWPISRLRVKIAADHQIKVEFMLFTLTSSGMDNIIDRKGVIFCFIFKIFSYLQYQSTMEGDNTKMVCLVLSQQLPSRSQWAFLEVEKEDYLTKEQHWVPCKWLYLNKPRKQNEKEKSRITFIRSS